MVATSFGILALIIVLIYANIGREISHEVKLGYNETRIQYLEESRTILRAWYERNKNTIEADPDALNVTTVLSDSGVKLKYGAQLLSTPRITSGALNFHVLALWIPEAGVTGVGFDAHGYFNQGVKNGLPATLHYTIVNGRDIQSDAVRSSLDQIDKLSNRMIGWFRMQQYLAQLEFRNSDNFFRISSCGNVSITHLPCINTFTNMMDSSSAIVTLRDRIGLAVGDARDGWGNGIRFTNLDGIPSGDFSISLKVVTPWGYEFTSLVGMN